MVVTMPMQVHAAQQLQHSRLLYPTCLVHDADATMMHMQPCCSSLLKHWNNYTAVCECLKMSRMHLEAEDRAQRSSRETTWHAQKGHGHHKPLAPGVDAHSAQAYERGGAEYSRTQWMYD